MDIIADLFTGSALLIALLIPLAFITFISLMRFYKRCPPDRILVVYGRVGRSVGGEARSAKCVHGGATFVVPVLQSYQYLELTPLTIDINLTSALSRENIRVNAPSTFTVGISSDPEIMTNAAERLLGLTLPDIEMTASDIIFGQFRATIATMKIEEINADREKFQQTVMINVEDELAKIGLRLINVNIKDVTDESGYLAALGKRAAAEATNKAKIEVAEQERDGAVGESVAHKERDIRVTEAKRDTRVAMSQAEAEAVKGEMEAKEIEAEAAATLRIKQAEASAQAVKGEKAAREIEVDAENKLRIRKAESGAEAAKSERIEQAEAEKASLDAERATEAMRQERDTAARLAQVVPEATAAKEETIIQAQADRAKHVIEAEAEKEAAERRGEGQGLEIRARMEQEAQGVRALLEAQAEGLQRVVQAAGGDASQAFLLMTAEKMPELLTIQTEALKQIKIDKVLVMDGGNGDGVANYIEGFAKALPIAHELAEMGGVKLPGLFMGEKTAAETTAPKPAATSAPTDEVPGSGIVQEPEDEMLPEEKLEFELADDAEAAKE